MFTRWPRYLSRYTTSLLFYTYTYVACLYFSNLVKSIRRILNTHLKFRLQLFSQAATDYIKKLFWEVVDERKQTGQTNEKDLVNHLLKLKENLKLPAETGTSK